MAKQNSINLIQFQKLFSTEEACQDHLFQMKWPQGFRCPKCGYDHCFVITSRRLNLFQCKSCRHQTTVTVGTVMEKTRVPLIKWFWAIFLIVNDKRGVSALRLSQELSITYKTAWLMQHKIRNAMSQRDSEYTLAGIVELDDAFFGAPNEGGKRGRGTDQTKVLVGLSLNKKGHPLHVKMKIIPDVKSVTLLDFANSNIEPGSQISSDAYRSYAALANEGFEHKPLKFNPKDNPDHLHWLHTVISNSKAFIAGTYHGLDSKHLQAYLDEFCYRFNRRTFTCELFNRLLLCCVFTKAISYSELTA
jgi:transposase-like protein